MAYYRRAMPRFVAVKDILDSGRIGRLRSVSIRNERPTPMDEAGHGWRVDPEISGGGYFVDLGSHTLDLLDWLLGPVTQAPGVAKNRGGRYRAEDLVTAAFAFLEAWKGSGYWNYDSFRYPDQVEIVGTAGVAGLLLLRRGTLAAAHRCAGCNGSMRPTPSRSSCPSSRPWSML